MLNFNTNFFAKVALVTTYTFAPATGEAQSNRDMLFDQFETSLDSLANPLVAADAMREIGDTHRQIVLGSINDTSVLWPSLASTDSSTDGTEMQQMLDACADIAFGRSDAEYSDACLSPDIFAIYSERQANQFIHFNTDVRQHPVLVKSLQMSVDHGSFGALILTGRRAGEAIQSVEYFSFARELAIANDNRMGRIAAEAHLIQILAYEQSTKDEILEALRARPSHRVVPFRRPSEEFVTVFFRCINEVLAADTENRNAKATCEDFFEGASVLPSELEDPAKAVSMTDLIWSQSGNAWIAREEIETSKAAFTFLKFEDLSCPATYWVSQYHISARPDGVGGRGLINSDIPDVDEVIQLGAGDSNQVFFHNDDFVTRGFRRNQKFAINNDDENFAYALLEHQQRVMHGQDGEMVRLTISISVLSGNCSGKFGWLYAPPERQQSEAKRLE